MYRFLARIVTALTIAVVGVSQLFAGDVHEIPKPEDCKIMAVMARDLLNLNEVRPLATPFYIFYRPEGDGYVEKCPWHQLGIEPSPSQDHDFSNMKFFSIPRYSSNMMSAVVDFTITTDGFNENGIHSAPITSWQICKLNKQDEGWHLDQCEHQGVMSTTP